MRNLAPLFVICVIFTAGYAYAAGETLDLLRGGPELPDPALMGSDDSAVQPETASIPPLTETTDVPALPDLGADPVVTGGVADPEPSTKDATSITGGATTTKSVLETNILPPKKETAPVTGEKTVQDMDVPADAPVETVAAYGPCANPCDLPPRRVCGCANFMPRHCRQAVFSGGCLPCGQVSPATYVQPAAPACAATVSTPAVPKYRKITKEITYAVQVPYQEVCTRVYTVNVPRWELRPTAVGMACAYTSVPSVAEGAEGAESVTEAAAAQSITGSAPAENPSQSVLTENTVANGAAAAGCMPAACAPVAGCAPAAPGPQIRTVMKPYCVMVPEERTQQYTVWKWRTETRKCLVEEYVCEP